MIVGGGSETVKVADADCLLLLSVSEVRTESETVCCGGRVWTEECVAAVSVGDLDREVTWVLDGCIVFETVDERLAETVWFVAPIVTLSVAVVVRETGDEKEGVGGGVTVAEGVNVSCGVSELVR